MVPKYAALQKSGRSLNPCRSFCLVVFVQIAISPDITRQRIIKEKFLNYQCSINHTQRNHFLIEIIIFVLSHKSHVGNKQGGQEEGVLQGGGRTNDAKQREFLALPLGKIIKRAPPF